MTDLKTGETQVRPLKDVMVVEYERDLWTEKLNAQKRNFAQRIGKPESVKEHAYGMLQKGSELKKELLTISNGLAHTLAIKNEPGVGRDDQGNKLSITNGVGSSALALPGAGGEEHKSEALQKMELMNKAAMNLAQSEI